MHYYCTLFDSNYLTRGLAMLESLTQHSQDFHLYIVAFDEIAYQVLTSISHPCTTVISMQDFQDQELLAIKPTRTRGEYCWTCTPSVILYCIETFSLPHCTYLDADLYFFSDPSILVDEMQDKSILITSHRYTPCYNQEKTSGIYCVQFMTFYADKNGMEALHWWRNQCIQWCFARFEDGKFGDQKYLDDWPKRFKGVHVLENLGGGLAPWNIQQFVDIAPIFYHFHHLNFIGEDKVDLGPYTLPQTIIKTIYTPYIRHLLSLRERFPNQNFDARSIPPITWKTPLRFIKRKIKKSYNVFQNIDF